MKIETLKITGRDTKVFPGDFNWECPYCGCINRAFQLPPLNEEGLWSKQDIQKACQSCSHDLMIAGKLD